MIVTLGHQGKCWRAVCKQWRHHGNLLWVDTQRHMQVCHDAGGHEYNQVGG